MKIKRKKISDVDLYLQMDRIFSRLDIRGNDRKDYCQYISDGEKHCKATTNKTCRNCKHFSPTFNSKLKAVVEYTIHLENTLQKLRMENEIKNAKIENLKNMNYQMRLYYDEYINKYSAVGKSVLRHRRKMEKRNEKVTQ